MLIPFVLLTVLLCFSSADHANDTFLECCGAINLMCPHMCSYPPPSPSLTDRLCMAASFSDYLKCYSGGKDNSECCRKAGVDKIGVECLDLCTPAAGKYAGLQYTKCAAANHHISACNQAANENLLGKIEMKFNSLLQNFRKKNSSTN